VKPGVITAMTAAELQSDDPDRLASRWSEIMERPVLMRDGQPVIALDDATQMAVRSPAMLKPLVAEVIVIVRP
jgi:hypothetical protein